MANKLIEVPGGRVVEFPETMADEEISSVLGKQFGQAPPPSTEIPRPQPATGDERWEYDIGVPKSVGEVYQRRGQNPDFTRPPPRQSFSQSATRSAEPVEGFGQLLFGAAKRVGKGYLDWRLRQMPPSWDPLTQLPPEGVEYPPFMSGGLSRGLGARVGRPTPAVPPTPSPPTPAVSLPPEPTTRVVPPTASELLTLAKQSQTPSLRVPERGLQ